MKKNIKKILILLVSSFVLFTASCKSNKGDQISLLNKHRSTEYKYDFIDYLDIDIIGPDKGAVLEVSVGDFKVTDFDSEADYISVRKFMEQLINYVVVTKTEGLENGDIIDIYIAEEFGNNQEIVLDINLDYYELLVQDLPEPKEVDLFSSDHVLFYNLKGTNEFYTYIKPTSPLNTEIQENLEYTVKCSDKNIVENQTILNVTAMLNSDFLSKNGGLTTDKYMKLQGYSVEYSAEKVLQKIIEPIDFKAIDLNMVKEKLNNFYKEHDTYVVRDIDFVYLELANIQQESEKEDGFEYIVHTIWFDLNNNNSDICLRDKVKMAIVEDELVILSSNSRLDNVKIENCYSADNRIELAQFSSQNDDLVTPLEDEQGTN